jgi:hypothetical protein
MAILSTESTLGMTPNQYSDYRGADVPARSTIHDRVGMLEVRFENDIGTLSKQIAELADRIHLLEELLGRP